MFNPEDSEEEVFRNMDQWIDKTIKTYLHQEILIILSVNLVSAEGGICLNPFDDVRRKFFQRMMSCVRNQGSDKIFYIFLDPPSEILHHFSEKGFDLSHQLIYDLSQDEDRSCQMRKLLTDLQQ
jgi:hypothetical protein